MNINLTAAQLRRAADLKDEIETLNHELHSIFGVADQPEPETPKRKVVRWTPQRLAKFRRTMRLKRQRREKLKY